MAGPTLEQLSAARMKIEGLNAVAEEKYSFSAERVGAAMGELERKIAAAPPDELDGLHDQLNEVDSILAEVERVHDAHRNTYERAIRRLDREIAKLQP